MGKFIFCYGTMNSSKSAQLLMWKYNYEESGFKVRLFKPVIDTREEFIDEHTGVVVSRIGLSAECTLIHPNETFFQYESINSKTDVIIVDEAQFLTKRQVENLYGLSLSGKIVICFGLKTDFKQELFEGSKRLIEIADELRELKTVCQCGKKATINARVDESGKLITEGEQVDIGGNEKYQAVCKTCFEKMKRKI